jgi:hypothetical protein
VSGEAGASERAFPEAAASSYGSCVTIQSVRGG